MFNAFILGNDRWSPKYHNLQTTLTFDIFWTIYEIYKGHDKYVIWIKTVFYSKWVDIGFRKNLISRPKHIESKSRLEVVVLG